MSEVAHAESPPKTGVLFAGMLAAFAAWILTLPVFPSQDGPMHRYYVHVLDSLLTHQHTYDVYRIRHPFPPYATHYFSLLALSHLFSFDLAEKIFVILVISCLAYGLRQCATSMGPNGGVISLFVFPLLLGWTLMMGFMNYSLGVGLMFLAAGLWQRASAGASSLWTVFVLVICLLTVTHPIPLLILIALCSLDLLLGLLWAPGSSLREYGERNWRRLVAVGFLCVAFLYPAASIDKSKSASTFAGFGIHPQQIAKNAALFGLSPYYTASHRPLINLYRLSLYLMLAGSLVLGALALREALRRRTRLRGEDSDVLDRQAIQTVNLSQTLFLAAILLGVALTFLPDYVNGSGFFGTRMMSLIWLGALVAAAGYRGLSGRAQRLLVYAGVLFAAISLVSAEVYFRPLARDLYAAEQEPMPSGQKGIVVQGPHVDDFARRARQVAFDPYAWGRR